MKKRIAIIGAGDLGQQIGHYALQTNSYIIAGYYDDTKLKDSATEFGPILGSLDDVQLGYEDKVYDELIIAIGYKHMDFRATLLDRYLSIPMATIIHPLAMIDSTATIGKGSVVFPGVLIDKKVVIGRNVIVNVHCTISHDTVIEDHCFLSPRVALAGFIRIGEKSVLGINSTVIDNLNLCNHTRLAGGTVLTKNTIKSGLYAGVPAQYKKA